MERERKGKDGKEGKGGAEGGSAEGTGREVGRKVRVILNLILE